MSDSQREEAGGSMKMTRKVAWIKSPLTGRKRKFTLKFISTTQKQARNFDKDWQKAARLESKEIHIHFYADQMGGINGHPMERRIQNVVYDLPRRVRDWVQSSLFFIAPGAARGLYCPQDLSGTRVIVLTKEVEEAAPKDAAYTIAHEIAHARLGHNGMTPIIPGERAADRQAAKWGFPAPSQVARRKDRYWKKLTRA